ncbi:UDP-3-O-(3-hydroxymyristoyl)glucosamine N-acyltransferase [Vibrio atypicus]|uniref:UDP-3-O-(3-hydroxymyristoyl)glucosamine N-acyltransferase n=1 Tax=Vibrio atypicus TaxID=558271 RepID=UPI001359B0D3|nr:UDP-3-O-(3-hydroxymyristoyl)glucosamine N-acyltransferase [Vibrio atypicus]
MFNIFECLSLLNLKYKFHGNINTTFTNFCSATNQKTNGITFLDGKRVKDMTLVNEGVCSVYILPLSMVTNFSNDVICAIFTEDPKITFCEIYDLCYKKKNRNYISKNSTIDDSSVVSPSSFIGNNVIIHEECVIEKGCQIGDNVVIYPNTKIGKNCVVESNTTIGSVGFGYYQSENGALKNFPHIGGVLIEDEVYIGSNVSIARGALSNTIIGRGSKIDNLVHISHNVKIGCNVMIVASAVICGSVVIGDDVWIGPNSIISDGVSIGNKAYISLGSTVIRDVQDSQKVTGYFATEHRNFIKLLKKNRGGI